MTLRQVISQYKGSTHLQDSMLAYKLRTQLKTASYDSEAIRWLYTLLDSATKFKWNQVENTW